MIKNGLYSAQFSSPLGAGSGVVVLNGNEFRGGDTWLAYLGTIADSNGKLNAELRTFRHSPGGTSVLGSDTARASLVGEVNGSDQLTLSDPRSGFKVVLHWQHE